MSRTVLVAGASGVIGQAALRHFAARPGWTAIGASRRAPNGADGTTFVPLDLTDRAACEAAAEGLSEVTDLVYAALHEKPGLIAGWLEADQMTTNLRMFQNLLDPLDRHARGLRWICLLQGTKAYGGHITPFPAPARERWPRREHENFYFLQEDHLRERQVGRPWSWTILRPQIVFGDAVGANMNPMTALGAYAAILAELGEPLGLPEGTPGVQEAVDADLLAEAVRWAAETNGARDETFNVTNGDVYVWPNVWPTVAAAFGLAVGPPVRRSVADFLQAHRATWRDIAGRHDLAVADVDALVGQSAIYLDRLLGVGRTVAPPPSLVSTIKIRRAGFAEFVDTEDMFVAWFRRLRAARLLPPVRDPVDAKTREMG